MYCCNCTINIPFTVGSVKIGFTTTIPVEFIFASGNIPIDLNNAFVSSANPNFLIDTAHEEGLPRNCCAWIKGLYSVGIKERIADAVICVTNGDCSNTHALTELFESSGLQVHPFSYPYGEKDKYSYLKKQMESLAEFLGITLNDAINYCEVTDPIRKKLKKIDALTVEGKISGFENHLRLISSTDFNSNLETFSKELDELIYIANNSPAIKKTVRIGFGGVPTINPSIYNFIENQNCKIVFNEVQRQFSIPSENPDYICRYIEYTYPYGINERIADIQKEITLRKIDGFIHYVQSFCYRQIQDILLRKNLLVPVLTIEGDSPGKVDGRTKIRIDSFIEMLENRKKRCKLLALI